MVERQWVCGVCGVVVVMVTVAAALVVRFLRKAFTGITALTLGEKLGVVAHSIRFVRRCLAYPTNTPPPPGLGPKFMSAKSAVELIADDAVVYVCGFAGCLRLTPFYHAIRRRFMATHHPKGLTIVSVTAQGGRGKAPGTVEELAGKGRRGLLVAYVSAHIETCKSLLRACDRGLLTVATLPQGVLARMFSMGGGPAARVTSPVGVGSFLDPRVVAGGASAAYALPAPPGSPRGGAVPPKHLAESVDVAARHVRLVPPPAGAAAGRDKDEQWLEYEVPAGTVLLLNCEVATHDGACYTPDAPVLTEAAAAARAIAAAGGRVLVAVSRVLPPGAPPPRGEPTVAAKDVAAVVVDPRLEQTATFLHTAPFEALCPGWKGDTLKALHTARLLNNIARITPTRGPVCAMLARMGAAVLAALAVPDKVVNVGVGYGEEVVRVLAECGAASRFHFTTEAGADGGLPLPGMYFGAAAGPTRLVPAVEMFGRYAAGELGVAVLGFLEIGRDGCVNVSRRGPHAVGAVGPGGFADICDAAGTIVFVGRLGTRAASVRVGHGVVTPTRHHHHHGGGGGGGGAGGGVKLVEDVAEVTFCSRRAAAAGKRVVYVTERGIFRLIPPASRGAAPTLQLAATLPGLDVAKDVVGFLLGRVAVPEPAAGAAPGAAAAIAAVPASVVSGVGFDPIAVGAELRAALGR